MESNDFGTGEYYTDIKTYKTPTRARHSLSLPTWAVALFFLYPPLCSFFCFKFMYGGSAQVIAQHLLPNSRT